jgi:predicted nuclease of predicted toxin-antitoxin system
MTRFLADENLNNQIVRGILRRNPEIDLVRAQDVGLSGVDDPSVLAWAAQENRIVLTYDVATMMDFAADRVQAGQSMPGLFEISRRVPVGLAIEEILLIAECSLPGEWEGQIRFLPLR